MALGCLHLKLPQRTLSVLASVSYSNVVCFDESPSQTTRQRFRLGSETILGKTHRSTFATRLVAGYRSSRNLIAFKPTNRRLSRLESCPTPAFTSSHRGAIMHVQSFHVDSALTCGSSNPHASVLPNPAQRDSAQQTPPQSSEISNDPSPPAEIHSANI